MQWATEAGYETQSRTALEGIRFLESICIDAILSDGTSEKSSGYLWWICLLYGEAASSRNEESSKEGHPLQSISNLIALLRMNLFTYRYLWDWIDEPFEVLSVEPSLSDKSSPFTLLDSNGLN